MNKEVTDRRISTLRAARIVLSQRYKVLISMAICASIAAIYLAAATKTYVSNASVLITAERGSLLDQTEQREAQITSTEIDTQVEIIKSERIVKNAVQNAGLTSEMLRPQNFRAVLSGIYSLLSVNTTSSGIEESRRDPVKIAQKLVAAKRRSSTYVIDISCSAPDPTIAQRLADAISTTFSKDDSVRLKGEKATILSPADRPEHPNFPRIIPVIGVSLAFGLLAGCIFVLWPLIIIALETS